MKKIICSVIAVMIIIVLTYILQDIVVINSIAQNDRFIQIGEKQYFHGYWFYVCYDKETKIQYTFSGKGGIEVLVNQEGQPLLYKD